MGYGFLSGSWRLFQIPVYNSIARLCLQCCLPWLWVLRKAWNVRIYNKSVGGSIVAGFGFVRQCLRGVVFKRP